MLRRPLVHSPSALQKYASTPTAATTSIHNKHLCPVELPSSCLLLLQDPYAPIQSMHHGSWFSSSNILILLECRYHSHHHPRIRHLNSVSMSLELLWPTHMEEEEEKQVEERIDETHSDTTPSQDSEPNPPLGRPAQYLSHSGAASSFRVPLFLRLRMRHGQNQTFNLNVAQCRRAHGVVS